MKKAESLRLHLSCPSARRSARLPGGRWRSLLVVALLTLTTGALHGFAGTPNTPGAIIGNGAVTLVDNGSTVTMSNGIVSINISKTGPNLNSVKYTYNNGGGTVTNELLAGSGQYYAGGGGLGGSTWVYASTNDGSLGDVTLTASDSTGKTVWHFSLLKGSSGFYTTAILSHATGNTSSSTFAFGLNSRWSSKFNWLSADDARDFFTGALPQSLYGGYNVPGAGHEMQFDSDGGLLGKYDDKFIYGQDHIDLKAWGWSSVGSGGLNVGVWEMTNLEFSDGGPLKRDVSSYPAGGGVALLVNNFLTEELNQGTDSSYLQDEQFTKVCGPWFTYLNNTPISTTDAATAADALFTDAKNQDTAEKTAGWPYYWFNDPNYPQASGRGTVTGQLKLSDSGNANPVVEGTWVGLEQEPTPVAGSTNNFQEWKKPYQYWTQTDSGGYYTFKNVRPGTNYTLFAYGRGIAGTFQSQNLKNGNPQIELDIPSSPLAPIVVTAGGTTTVPAVTWTAKRVGATVFEIGYPDRKGDKFRHGDDYWVPDAPTITGTAPKFTAYPTGLWGGAVRFPIEYPGDAANNVPPLTLDYNVGTSQWATDWNYILPSQETDAINKTIKPATANISFNLASDPAANAQASIYVAIAATNYDTRTADGSNQKNGVLLVEVNGTPVLTSDSGVTSSPCADGPLAPAKFLGLVPNGGYTDDSGEHCSDHGPFWDDRITFPASRLHAGTNTVTLVAQANIKGMINGDPNIGGAYVIFDYLRLELQGYVPPTPGRTAVFPGNNRNLVTWPIVPGATRYNLLRSGNPTTGFTSLASGIVARDYVVGDGHTIMAYTDTSAVNGQNYYYDVQAVNPTGTSAASTAPPRGTPFASPAQSTPAAPTGLSATVGHNHVALSWSASAEASYYQVLRTTLHNDNAGSAYSIQPNGSTLLSDYTTGTTFSDDTPTDGEPYGYTVVAVNAAGTSSASAELMATPLPPKPASAPANLTAARKANGSSLTVNLSWTAVPGATGYTIYRSTSPGTPVYPDQFIMATYRTTFVDVQADFNKVALDPTKTYYYQVTAVNTAGIGPAATFTSTP